VRDGSAGSCWTITERKSSKKTGGCPFFAEVFSVFDAVGNQHFFEEFSRRFFDGSEFGDQIVGIAADEADEDVTDAAEGAGAEIADVEGKQITYQIDGNISAGSVNTSAITVNMASETLDTAAAVITFTGNAYTVDENDVKTRNFDYGNLTFIGGTRPGAVIVDGSLYVNSNMIYNDASYTAETTVIDLGGATIAANYASAYATDKNAYSFNTDTTINDLAKKDATAITVFSGSHTASSNTTIRLQNDVLIYGATVSGNWHLAPGAHTSGTHTVWIVDSNIGAHYLTYNTTYLKRKFIISFER